MNLKFVWGLPHNVTNFRFGSLAEPGARGGVTMMVDPFPGEDGLPFGQKDERRGLLVVADTGDMPSLEPLADAAGLRLLGQVSLGEAPDRLDMQADCDIVLLHCPRPDSLLERLIVQIETVAIQNNIAVILLAGIDTVDLAFGCLRNPRTELLCTPDERDIACALIAAATNRPLLHNVHEATQESEGMRLQQLSEEVSRLARTIEALADRRPVAAPAPAFDLRARLGDRAPGFAGMPALPPMGSSASKDAAPVTAGQVRDMLRARRMRADFLPGDLFADPAWDMLLDLLAARLEQERVSVSSLCIASAVPPTTALRWIRTLTDRALVVRRADPMDGRRIFIALADETAEQLMRWFAASRRYLTA